MDIMDLMKNSSGNQSGISLIHLMELWKDHQNTLVRIGSKKASSMKEQWRIAGCLTNLLTPQFPVARIRNAVAQRYVAERLESGVSPGTINNELDVLRMILGFACDEGYIEARPKIKSLPTPTTEKDLPSLAKIKEFVESMPMQHRLPLQFSMLTGLSWYEIEQLQWRDIDRKHYRLFIGYRDDFELKTPQRKRELHISKAANAVIKEAAVLFCRENGKIELPPQEGTIFPAATGTRKFMRRNIRWQYKGITPATMRKVFASVASKHVSEPVLQRIMGHAIGSTMTRKHYVRSTREEKTTAMDLVSANI